MESYSQESNKDKYTEVRELFLNSINKIELKYFDPEIQKFYEKIQRKYTSGQYQHCLLWHLVIGSTTNDSNTVFDTPDGDIEDFIRNDLPRIAENKE